MKNSFSIRKLHKVLGLILILPILGWSITGMVFFIKPGYSAAYEQLSVKTYPIEKPWLIEPRNNWEELKLVRTVLGTHLLVKDSGETSHLDPETLEQQLIPSQELVKELIDDAISVNRERYGEILENRDLLFKTSTGVEIKLDWNNLRLSQKGKDTRLINNIYKVHYLQWSPSEKFNKFLGFFGLFLLVSLSFFGIRIYLKGRR